MLRPSSKYSDIAREAAAELRAAKVLTRAAAEAAWKRAAARHYPDKKASRDKSCPRGAFLGLASGGWIVGVAPFDCNSESSSAIPAREVARLLLGERGAELAKLSNAALWRKTRRSDEQHNNQVDVVKAFLPEGLRKPLLHSPGACQ